MAIEKKIALITGASRGIGRAIASHLGEKHTIIGTATSDLGAQAITKHLQENNIDGCGVCLDITNDRSISEIIEFIQHTYGAPTVLVNNAGIVQDNLLMRMKESEWFRVIDTNLSGAYRLSKKCLKGMTKARWGRIINISSIVGCMGNAGQTNYAASKAGLEGFTRALAREVGIRQITVNAVAPGFIDTDMTKDLDENTRKEFLSRIPLGRLGHPLEIASLVNFLVTSEGGNYMTGETIHINGGMYMA